MKVLHDTRDDAFRKPYGALELGASVELSVDVAESPGAEVLLRTWIDGVGETLYAMEPESGNVRENDAVRYRATLCFDKPGIVWYQFVINDKQGFMWRYGAKSNRMGGIGRLVGWEPPSFKLSVYDPHEDAPTWHRPIDGFLHDPFARADVPELIATLLENYPLPTCLTAMPWDAPETVRTPEVNDMARALELAEGEGYAWFSIGVDVFGFWRKTESGAMTCALFNASPHDERVVFVPMVDEEVSELVVGNGVAVVDVAELDGKGFGELQSDLTAQRFARVHLGQFGSAVLHFHAHDRLAFPMVSGLGVLAHITSLPTDDGRPGTLGAPARAFIDWLADAGVRYWQVLPANPTDECGSPYAGISAFAGNAHLVEGDMENESNTAVASAPDEYRAFCDREADWLDPYACFMAIRLLHGKGKPWQEWPNEYRAYDPTMLKATGGLADAAEAIRRQQFAFDLQWKDVRSYANERGVMIIGDMPMYVSSDSADVWAHPELFQLESDGLPAVVAGCPPDAFAVDGQIWGNPVYDWVAVKANGYAWWLSRLQRAFELYDYVRLDHFIGFSRYFSIPVGEKALAGTYRRGPGYELFKAAYDKLGKLPVIAEDLGLLTPRVRALVADCGFPGMDIIQFADGGDPLSFYAPRPEKIVYTGTHDNQTLLGYVMSRYMGADESEAFEALIQAVVSCDAPVRILPLQDVLTLDDEARMNVPGVAEGNWVWQADIGDVMAASMRLSELAGE